MRWAWVVVLGLWACNGTNTGNPADRDHGDQGEDSFGRCDETITTLGSLQEEAPNGLRGADLLALAEGTHTSTLRWGSSNPSVEVGPENGDHELTVEVRYDGGEIRFVERRQDPDRTTDDWVSCPNHFELEVQLELRTEEGALDESLAATLRAEDAGYASLGVDIDPDALNGSLSVETSAEGYEPEDIGVSIAFSEHGSQGRLSTLFQRETADAVSAFGADLAHWPAGSICEVSQPAVAYDEAYAEFSARDAVDAANDHPPLQITWNAEAQVDLSVELSFGDGMACAVAVAEGAYRAGTLIFDGMLDVDAGDGSWVASFPVRVEALATDAGALGEVRVTVAEDGTRSTTESELEAVYGLESLDTAGFERLDIRLEGTFSADGTRGEGELRVYGYEPPDCPPDPDPNDGMSPGCPGPERVEIEAASWTGSR